MINFASNLNKMISAGLGGPLDPPRTEVAVGHRVVYTEASGAVVNFETNVIAPMKNIRVTMEPVQDLHGYNNPWPAGGGKNLFDPSAAAVGENWNGSALAYSIASDYIPVTAEATYAFSVSDMPKFTSLTAVCLDSSKNYITSRTNQIFTTPSDCAYVRLSIRCASDQSWTEEDLSAAKIQLELGSTATAYAPYSNICPISGRDTVRIWREAEYDQSADPALTIQLGQTVYGGTVDVTTGVMTVTRGEIASYAGETLPGEWISDRDVYAAGITPTIGAQVVYVLADSFTIELTPAQLSTLKGQNNVWSDAGNISLEYPYYEETEGY